MKKNYIILILVIIICLIGYIVFKPKNESPINIIVKPIENKVETPIISEEKEISTLNETAIALIKNIYQKDNKYYVVLDYMTVRENKSMNNLDLENLNKKLRTFELDSNTKIQLIRYKENLSEQPIVKPAELYRILKNNGEDYYFLSFYEDNPSSNNPFYKAYASPFSVKIEQGKLVELKEIYQE